MERAWAWRGLRGGVFASRPERRGRGRSRAAYRTRRDGVDPYLPEHMRRRLAFGRARTDAQDMPTTENRRSTAFTTLLGDARGSSRGPESSSGPPLPRAQLVSRLVAHAAHGAFEAPLRWVVQSPRGSHEHEVVRSALALALTEHAHEALVARMAVAGPAFKLTDKVDPHPEEPLLWALNAGFTSGRWGPATSVEHVCTDVIDSATVMWLTDVGRSEGLEYLGRLLGHRQLSELHERMVEKAGEAPTRGLLGAPDLHTAFGRFLPQVPADIDLPAFREAVTEILLDEADGFEAIPF